MLNKISTICSSVFLVFTFVVPGHADEHFPFLAEVSKESVNVRAGPNTNFEKVDKLSKGTQVVVLGRSYEWYKVQPLSTTKSYIRSDYLTINQGESIAAVQGNNVNVRCQPNSDAASLGEIKKGTLVKVIEQVNGWCRLEPVAGTTAWIHQDFLKEIAGDVPASLLIPAIQAPSPAAVAAAPATVQWQSVPEAEFPPKREVIETVSLQGKLQALPQAPDADVHYEIIIDDKNVYYIKDIPQISSFADAVVTVEGVIIPDLQKKFTYPLVHINKIALVL